MSGNIRTELQGDNYVFTNELSHRRWVVPRDDMAKVRLARKECAASDFNSTELGSLESEKETTRQRLAAKKENQITEKASNVQLPRSAIELLSESKLKTKLLAQLNARERTEKAAESVERKKSEIREMAKLVADELRQSAVTPVADPVDPDVKAGIESEVDRKIRRDSEDEALRLTGETYRLDPTPEARENYFKAQYAASGLDYDAAQKRLAERKATEGGANVSE